AVYVNNQRGCGRQDQPGNRANFGPVQVQGPGVRQSMLDVDAVEELEGAAATVREVVEGGARVEGLRGRTRGREIHRAGAAVERAAALCPVAADEDGAGAGVESAARLRVVAADGELVAQGGRGGGNGAAGEAQVAGDVQAGGSGEIGRAVRDGQVADDG